LGMLFALEFWWVPFAGPSVGIISITDIGSSFFNYEPGFGLFNPGPFFFRDNPNPSFAGVAGVNLAITTAVAVALLALASWQVARISRVSGAPGLGLRRSQVRKIVRVGNWMAAVAFAFTPAILFMKDPSLWWTCSRFLGVAAQLLLLLLVVRSVAGEKEAHTLESLVCTPLSNASIVHQKIGNAWELYWGWYLLLSAPRVLLFVRNVKSSYVQTILLILVFLALLFETLAISSLRCFCSSWARSTRTALALALPLWIVLETIAHHFLWGFVPLPLFLAILPDQTRGALLLSGYVLIPLVMYLVLLKRFRRFAFRQ
jgi:ABC-type transport system involved in multi-copper enzyme maturation permease subunit